MEDQEYEKLLKYQGKAVIYGEYSPS